MKGVIAYAEDISIGTTSDTCYLELLADSSQDYRILEVGVFFSGTSATAEPIDVSLARHTVVGGTPSATNTSTTVYDGRITYTALTTDYDTFGTDPTKGDLLWTAHVHPQGGIIWQPPVELICDGSDAIGLWMQATTAAVDCNYYIIIGE
jgi:hypothetical protein